MMTIGQISMINKLSFTQLFFMSKILKSDLLTFI